MAKSNSTFVLLSPLLTLILLASCGSQIKVTNLGRAADSLPVPHAPQGVGIQIGSNQVILSWHAVSSATGYVVLRSGQPGDEVDSASGITTPQFQDTSVLNGTPYFYTVVAVNAAGRSQPSNEVGAVPAQAAPGAPLGLSAQPGDAQVGLSWTAVAGAISYCVNRSTVRGQEMPLVVGLSDPSYLDLTATNGMTYYYTVVAVGASGSSSASGEVIAKPQLGPPPTPGNLQAYAGDAQISLTWNAVPGATAYLLNRGTGAGLEQSYQTGLSQPNFTDSNLKNGTAYYYTVQAVTAGGTSHISLEANTTPKAAANGSPTRSWVSQSGTLQPDSASVMTVNVSITVFNTGDPTQPLQLNGGVGILGNIGPDHQYLLNVGGPAASVTFGMTTWNGQPVKTAVILSTPFNFSVPSTGVRTIGRLHATVVQYGRGLLTFQVLDEVTQEVLAESIAADGSLAPYSMISGSTSIHY